VRDREAEESYSEIMNRRGITERQMERRKLSEWERGREEGAPRGRTADRVRRRKA
jgi:hypothetical protein